MTGARSAFDGRRVLVTGHTGFKGGWLVAWLRRLGAAVGGLALPPGGTPSLFAQAAILRAYGSQKPAPLAAVDLYGASKAAAGL